MDTKIKDKFIFCPECGAPGPFTCTNCKHEVRFSMQWNRAKEESEKESLKPDEGETIEESTTKATGEDVPVEQLKESEEITTKQKQVLIDEIKAGLHEDIKNAITEAASIIKEELLNELKPEKESKEPDDKSAKSKEKESEKESSNPDEGETWNRSVNIM